MVEFTKKEDDVKAGDGGFRTVLIVHVAAEWRNFHRQSMLLALARQLPPSVGMLCVNRPISLDVAPWKHARKFWTGVWRTRVWSEDDGRVRVMTPRLALHELIAPRIPGAGCLNRWLMAVQLRRTLTRQFPDAIKVVQWIYHPAQQWILDVIADAGRIYECYDEHAWTTRGGGKARLWQQEKEILTSVDLTFVTTTGLMKTRMPLARRLELLPNGVPEFFFDEVGPQSDPLDWIPRPRLGYLGNARSVVDFDLLEQLLRRRPEWHMVFLGPIEHRSAVAALRALPNVHFLGTRPRTDVPNIVRHFDVGLVPFLDNEFTRVMSTLKLCEYLAVGVPVVATDLPGVRLFENSIRLAPREVEGFERAIAETLALDRSALSPHLIAAARPYSWNEICRRHVVPVLADVFHW